MSGSHEEGEKKPEDAVIAYSECRRSMEEGAFISPCGTEGCLWEGFPEWPEEFPYDAFPD